MPHADRVVLVTGAAGSLGQAVARRFKRDGAKLVLTDLDGDRLEAAANQLDFDPETDLAITGNVTDEASARGLVAEALARFGRLDVLANVAGGFRMGPPVHEMPLDDWDFLMNLNAKSVLVMAKAVVPAMIERGQGRIINVAARAALQGAGHMAAYSASKAAVIRLTESMATELLDRGITVNCILPSTIDTPPNRAAMPKADFSKWVAPDSLANVVAFLASEAARDVSGAAVPVYGRA